MVFPTLPVVLYSCDCLSALNTPVSAISSSSVSLIRQISDAAHSKTKR